jgi:hypothetical protein
MAWHGMDLGIFGMDGKGYRYGTRIDSWVAGATFLFSSFSSSWTAETVRFFSRWTERDFHFEQVLYFISLP